LKTRGYSDFDPKVRKKYNYYSRKGFTLSVLIIVVVILVIIGMALLALSVNEFNFSAREENRIQAYYIAREPLINSQDNRSFVK
jgi:Tfp pilus assembly protein PilX